MFLVIATAFDLLSRITLCAKCPFLQLTHTVHMLHGGMHKSCCVPVLITAFHNYPTLNQKETCLGAMSASQVLSRVA